MSLPLNWHTSEINAEELIEFNQLLEEYTQSANEVFRKLEELDKKIEERKKREQGDRLEGGLDS